MIPWKKKQPPVHHDTNHERIKSMEARIAKLEAQPVQQPPVVLYKLDAGEDVLVQCVVGDERVSVPLSQIVAQVVQAMATKVKAAGVRGSRTVKTTKQQGGQPND